MCVQRQLTARRPMLATALMQLGMLGDCWSWGRRCCAMAATWTAQLPCSSAPRACTLRRAPSRRALRCCVRGRARSRTAHPSARRSSTCAQRRRCTTMSRGRSSLPPPPSARPPLSCCEPAASLTQCVCLSTSLRHIGFCDSRRRRPSAHSQSSLRGYALMTSSAHWAGSRASRPTPLAPTWCARKRPGSHASCSRGSKRSRKRRLQPSSASASSTMSIRTRPNWLEGCRCAWLVSR
mmetsp:Transcript_23082/g.59307  ORF Transcript_23082/g.59307 Transcript_23082/m.59307 type:complete len:237 (+) Transcript_23082:174-884(+)